MTNLSTEFNQGDSSDVFQIAVYSQGVQVVGVDLNDYSGKFAVVKKLGLDPLLTKNMVVVDDTFRAVIEPAESQALATGQYIAITEITNTDVSFRKEDHTTFSVRKQGYTAP